MLQELRELVKPYYQEKDSMHDLSHIDRVLEEAKELAEERDVDEDLIAMAVHLHGILNREDAMEEAREFLKENVGEEKARKVVNVAEESQKESEPRTLEGKVLHDAHLVEGGKTFHVVKSFAVGGARGQSVEETVKYLEENILGEFECRLPEAQQKYREKERYAREFLEQLRKDLDT